MTFPLTQEMPKASPRTETLSEGPRILTIDIETRPAIVATFQLRNVFISIEQIIEPGRVICFAAKWRDEDEVMFASEWHMGHDEMVRFAYDLLDEADIVIHYNGKRFDEPHLNREFLELGLTPPAPYKAVDLFTTNSKTFKFDSGKLAFITERLQLTGKMKHEGFELWMKVMAGEEQARADMEAYNIQDVVTTEELYEVLLPWVKGHPNMGLYVDVAERVCPNCLSTKVQRRGFSVKQKRSYQRWHCQNCGKWTTGSRAVNAVDLGGVA